MAGRALGAGWGRRWSVWLAQEVVRYSSVRATLLKRGEGLCGAERRWSSEESQRPGLARTSSLLAASAARTASSCRLDRAE